LPSHQEPSIDFLL